MNADRDGRPKHRGQSPSNPRRIGHTSREAGAAPVATNGAMDRRSFPVQMIVERRRNRGCLSQVLYRILDRYAACRRNPTAPPVGGVGHSQRETGSGGSGRKREAAGISVEHSQSVDRWRFRAAGPRNPSTAGSALYFCYRTRCGGCPLSSAMDGFRTLATQKARFSPGGR